MIIFMTIWKLRFSNIVSFLYGRNANIESYRSNMFSVIPTRLLIMLSNSTAKNYQSYNERDCCRRF